MKRTIRFIFVLSLSLLIAEGCVGTEVGNPPADVEIDFVSIEEEEVSNAQITNLSLRDGIEIDRAVIVVGSLRFRKCGPGENESDAEVTEPFLAELLSENVIETRIDLPTGTYCRLDVRPQRGGEDGLFADSPELDGYTVYAEGSYEGTPLLIQYEGDDEISFTGEFTIEPETSRLFIGVAVETWFDGVDLATAEVEDGSITLGGEDDNDGLLEALSDNFEASITVAVDRDGDGSLDPEELAPED